MLRVPDVSTLRTILFFIVAILVYGSPHILRTASVALISDLLGAKLRNGNSLTSLDFYEPE